jgi:phytol kinase
VSITWRDAIFIAAVIIGMLSVMGGVRYFGRRFGIDAEMQRKLIHVTTGTVALFFPLLFTNALPVFLLIGAALILMFALRSPALASVGGVLHDVKRESYGEIYLALAIAFTFFRAQGEPILYVLPLLVITLSDTASALVGTSYGRRRFPVEDGTKSLEGVVAFFTVTWLVAMVTLLLLTDAPRLNVVILSFLIAAFCALVEAESWRGLDNLFVPIGAHLLLQQYLGSSSGELVLTTLVFVAFLGLMLVLAETIGMPRRAARGYAILLFLMFSMMGLQNALFTVLVIAGQLVARSRRPGTSQRPELDLLAVAAVVAMFWLLAGELSGHSVLGLFNLTFAGAVLGYAALALNGRWRLVLVPLGAVVAAIFLWVAYVNLPLHPPWFTEHWPWLAAALALSAAVPTISPMVFQTRRSLKLFLVAMLVPLGFYVTEILQ